MNLRVFAFSYRELALAAITTSMRFAKVSAVMLFLNAAAFLAFAVQWDFFTKAMAHTLGIDLTNGDALTDAQAVYGGLKLGSGVFLMIYAFKKKLLHTGLFASTLMLGGLLFCRGTGILLSPPPVTVATWKRLSTDALGAVVNGILLIPMSRAKPAVA